MTCRAATQRETALKVDITRWQGILKDTVSPAVRDLVGFWVRRAETDLHIITRRLGKVSVHNCSSKSCKEIKHDFN